MDEQIVKHEERKWGSKVSAKLFMDREYVVKHIQNKHQPVIQAQKDKARAPRPEGATPPGTLSRGARIVDGPGQCSRKLRRGPMNPLCLNPSTWNSDSRTLDSILGPQAPDF